MEAAAWQRIVDDYVVFFEGLADLVTEPQRIDWVRTGSLP
jgi:hypothetical protein